MIKKSAYGVLAASHLFSGRGAGGVVLCVPREHLDPLVRWQMTYPYAER